MSASQERVEVAESGAHICEKNDEERDEAGCGGSEIYRSPSPVPSCVSMKSEESMGLPLTLDSGPAAQSKTRSEAHRPSSPVPSCVSMRSEESMGLPLTLSSGSAAESKPESEAHRPPSPAPSCVSMKSDMSMGLPLTLDSGPAAQSKTRVLRADQSMGAEGEQELSDSITCGSINNKQTDYEVLRRVKEKHKASLKKRFENISEGIIKPGAEILLDNIYIELYITRGESEGVNKEHEVWQVESTPRRQTTEDTPINCNDIFKPLPGQDKHIRTVMTKGVAGIGKTVSVQKFILDWTDGQANQDVDFMFPLSFRKLNLVRGDLYSFHRLLLDFHPELKELNDGKGYKDCRVVFIFDGLDECRLLLNFQQSMMMSDLMQTSSVDLLMTSLIQGTLLPSALIWITSRPAAVHQIPAQCIDQFTEVRGFTDSNKEEYFRKKISDEGQAIRIISHIKASRSLEIMCHIPVFCWIAATVLQHMMEQENTPEIPKTLTEMFIHFLLIQTTRKNQKYQSGSEAYQENPLVSQSEIVLKLAELAFNGLEHGNVIFYEEDLQETGIDVSEASVYSGMCTEIFKEESIFNQRKVYCFVHLSVQEFLAAVFVFHSFVTENLEALKTFLSEEQRKKSNPSLISSILLRLGLQSGDNLHVLLKSAVDKALESQNGHLDLFLRFLMGLSLERNHMLLQGLLNCTHDRSNSIKETCQYIKKLNREGLSPERCVNLFQCLLEMNDDSMHKEIQIYLSSPKNINQELTPAHCSALAHMLLMSDQVLDEFDLKKYNTSDEGCLRLLPAVRGFKKAQLAGCELSDKSCQIVATVLQSPNSLIELDLSDNDLGNSGVQLLSKGLSSPHCKLQILRLCKCGFSDEGYVCLALALMLNPSCVKELDVSNNHPGQSAQKLLSALLKDPLHRVEALKLAGCELSDKSCQIVATVLQSPNSLIELDLSDNDLGNSGVQLLSKGLSSPYCKLQTLRLSKCGISDEGHVCLALALMLNPSCVKELDVSNNHPGQSAQKLLSATLEDPLRRVEALQLAGCELSDKSCQIVATVLQSPNSLIELDLSDNDLGNSGVQLLSKGLSSPYCKLQTLRLCRCGISDEGYGCLAQALMLNPSSVTKLDVSNNHPGQKLLSATLEHPLHRVVALQRSFLGSLIFEGSSESHLKEVERVYNHPGEEGLKLLSEILEDPVCKLETLKTCADHCAETRLRSELQKYACELTLDPNTTHRKLSLSEENRKLTRVSEERPYPDHPERFDVSCQVLCREGLSGRCYWEAEWSDRGAGIAMAYKSINRKEGGYDFMLGRNPKSWSLECSDGLYFACHNDEEIAIRPPSDSKRVGVYLDCPSGTLSFYSVASDKLTHLYTFHSKFTEPLFPGFLVWSSVSLYPIT